jgi:hypothetical protein
MGKKSFKEWFAEKMRLNKWEKFSLWFGLGCALFGAVAWGYYFIFQAAGCM